MSKEYIFVRDCIFERFGALGPTARDANAVGIGDVVGGEVEVGGVEVELKLVSMAELW